MRSLPSVGGGRIRIRGARGRRRRDASGRGRGPPGVACSDRALPSLNLAFAALVRRRVSRMCCLSASPCRRGRRFFVRFPIPGTKTLFGGVSIMQRPPTFARCRLQAPSPVRFLSGDGSWRLRRGIPRAADALPMRRKPLYPTLCPPVARSTLPQTVKSCQEAEHERNRVSRHEKWCGRAGWPSPRVRGLIVCVPLRGFAVELGRVARLRPVARMNRFHLYLR